MPMLTNPRAVVRDVSRLLVVPEECDIDALVEIKMGGVHVGGYRREGCVLVETRREECMLGLCWVCVRLEVGSCSVRVRYMSGLC